MWNEELMKMAECETAVKFYLPDNPQGFEMLNQIRADLLTLQADQEIDLGELQVTISYQEEEDWETAWKKYYRPIVVSDTLAVVPEWEKFDAREGRWCCGWIRAWPSAAEATIPPGSA